jgi:hypothetical protein
MGKLCLTPAMINTGIYYNPAHPAQEITPAFELMQRIKHFQHGFIEHSARFINIPGIPYT